MAFFVLHGNLQRSSFLCFRMTTSLWQMLDKKLTVKGEQQPSYIHLQYHKLAFKINSIHSKGLKKKGSKSLESKEFSTNYLWIKRKTLYVSEICFNLQ